MRKLFMLFAAALLLFGLSGQAMAYFEQGDLVRVVYDNSGLPSAKEIVTDLGSGFNLTSPTSAQHTFNTNNFSLNSLGISDWTNVQVAYFTFTANPSSAWASGPDGGQSNMARSWPLFSGPAGDILGANHQTGLAQTINPLSVATSYATSMGTDGNFGGLIRGGGDQNLADLATKGYVDQWLYYYADGKVAASGVKLYNIRTFADGTSQINAVTTPIPAAIYLLGSGLLGLVGIRRRKSA